MGFNSAFKGLMQRQDLIPKIFIVLYFYGFLIEGPISLPMVTYV